MKYAPQKNAFLGMKLEEATRNEDGLGLRSALRVLAVADEESRPRKAFLAFFSASFPSPRYVRAISLFQ